jgi:hypothetical protein
MESTYFMNFLCADALFVRLLRMNFAEFCARALFVL